MKTLKVIVMVLAIAISHPSFAFDTANGQYLSEQDLMTVLRSVFIRPGLLDSSSYMLMYFDYNQVKSSQKPFYELGFINLDSGEMMTQAPDASYILAIDAFVTAGITGICLQHYGAGLQMIFSKEVKDFVQAQQMSAYSFFNSDRIEKFPANIRLQMAKDIAAFIYQDQSLIPAGVIENIETKILPGIGPSTVLVKDFVTLIFKKIIISDEFLRY